MKELKSLGIFIAIIYCILFLFGVFGLIFLGIHMDRTIMRPQLTRTIANQIVLPNDTIYIIDTGDTNRLVVKKAYNFIPVDSLLMEEIKNRLKRGIVDEAIKNIKTLKETK